MRHAPGLDTPIATQGEVELECDVAAVAFFQEVMEVAEAEGHHPDLHLTNYRDVRVGPTMSAMNTLLLLLATRDLRSSSVGVKQFQSE